MRRLLVSASLASLLAAAAPAAAQMSGERTLNLSFDASGRVTLEAQNVTPREILAEWARQCGCYIVNADKLTTGPLALPVRFEGASQSKVLESLLREAAGYVLTPKGAAPSGPSNYETIFILATSNPVASPYVPPASTTAYQPLPTAGSPDDEIPPVVPLVPMTASEAPAPASTPASSNPFGSSPFGSRTSNPSFGSPANTGSGPGTQTPPPAPMPVPGGATTGPTPSGVAVPIVPVPPPGQ